MSEKLLKKTTSAQGEVLLYQTGDGATRIEVRMEGETVWLSLKQLVELFQRDKSVISRHIRNIFEERELKKGSPPLSRRTSGCMTSCGVDMLGTFLSLAYTAYKAY